MYIIPAIDIRGGKCVRLVQGNPNQETVYSKSPVEQAKLWESSGVKLLHIVDLDGAFSGVPKNLEIIKKIREELSIDLEVGGGIRDMHTIKDYLQIGINRIVVGSAAVRNREFIEEACQQFPNSIIVGVDVINGNVAIHGWKDVTDIHFYRFIADVKKLGVNEIILTDVQKDGMLQGINSSFFEKALEEIKLPIIASGGISELDDIKKLAQLKSKGLKGAIIGKALYENRIDLSEALKIAEAG